MLEVDPKTGPVKTFRRIPEDRQFASLIRFLFAKYDDIPAFMDSAWNIHDGPYAAAHRRWYIHVGSGQNLRKCDLPICYTNRMAHAFRRAPSMVTK